MTTPPEANSLKDTWPKLPGGFLCACFRYVRIVGAILLLGAVWYLLFLWGMTVTRQWLAWWAPNPVAGAESWPALLVNLLRSKSGSTLPAFFLVLTSLALFFYRLPRVPRRLSVPVEFAMTTALFVAVNLLTVQLLQRLAQAAFALTSNEASVADVDPIHFVSELNLVLTLVMLAGLFWLQGSGYLPSTWRQWRRSVSAG